MANINGTSGDDSLVGTDNDDTLRGLAGADSLRGLDGDDVLDGGTGADFMRGGLGDDIYVVDSAGDVVSENGGQGYDTVRAYVSYTLAANVERLDMRSTTGSTGTGNSLDNFLSGNTGKDVLYGLGGNDYLDGFTGDDRMYGGTGDDTYVIRDAGDIASEKDGGGHDKLNIMGIDYALGSGIEDAAVQVGNNVTITGNSLANVITSSGGNDFLFGGGGDDRIRGGAGDDEIHGGIGVDVLLGEDGADTFVFLSAADMQVGDRVEGGTNDGSIDTILVTGGGIREADLSRVDFAGIEHIESSATVTRLSVDQIADMRDAYDAGDLADVPTIVAREFAIADGGYVDLSPFGIALDVTRIRLSDEGNTVDSGRNFGGFDVAVYGGAGDDTIYGGFGPPQTLFGRGGDDWLDGGTSGGVMGSGPAQLTGGSGIDVFTMTGSAGRTADILDFRNGTDQVAFSQRDGGYFSYQEFLDAGGTVTAENGGTRLTLVTAFDSPEGLHNENYFLAGIDPSRIDASDFYQA